MKQPFFLLKNLDVACPFYMVSDTPVLDFFWSILQVLKPEWAALLALGRGVRDVFVLLSNWIKLNGLLI